jgi:hypothetical protein
VFFESVVFAIPYSFRFPARLDRHPRLQDKEFNRRSPVEKILALAALFARQREPRRRV